MTQQHTPGPWSMRETYSNGEPDGIVIEPMGYDFNSGDNDEDYVNALLFIVAPELLEELEHTLFYLQLDPGSSPSLMADIRATIAKATGENKP